MPDSFLGSGDLYIDRLTEAGVATGLEKVGNADKFEIKAEAEVLEQTSKGRDTYGQVLASASLAKPSTLGITLNQLDRKALAMAFLGEDADISIAGSSVTDEALTAKLDKWVEVAFRDISTVIVTDSTGTTTYVLDTDYIVHARLGMIQALSTGAITEDESLLVDYAYAGESGYRVEGATKPTIRAKLKLDGKNFANGKACIVEVYEAQLAPDSAVDFLSDEFSVLELTGTMITPDDKDHPFYLDQLD